MRKFFFFLQLLLYPYLCFCQPQKPVPSDSINWLGEMTREVAMVKQPQDSLREWMNRLDVICKDDHKNYKMKRPQAVVLCRKIIRMGLLESAGFPTSNYIQLLKQLSGHFHECNDTLMALALELEYNRLYYDQNMTIDLVGKIASKETRRLFGLFGIDTLKPRIRLLWLSNYLFGLHGLASRIEAELSIQYITEEHHFSAGMFYWERAKKSKNSVINDANTNWSFVMMRDSVVIPYLTELGKQDKEYRQQLEYRELLYHSDQSEASRQARLEMLPIVEQTHNSDIMSALLYRELGIDYLSQSDLNYAIYHFRHSIDNYQKHAKNNNDTLLWSNTLYLLGTTLERCGNVKEAKHAYEQTAKLLEDKSSIDFSLYFSLVALARVCISQGEHYSTRKAIGAIESILNGNDSLDFHFDFLPDIGAEYKNKMQVRAMLYTSYFNIRALEFESIDIDKSIDYAYYAKQYLDQVDLTDNYFYYHIQILLARLQLKREGLSSSQIGKVPLPASLLSFCVEAYQQGKTIELPDAAMAYCMLGEIAARESKENEAAACFRKSYQTISDYAIRHLFTMTEGNRAKFWEKVKPILLETQKECIRYSESMPSLVEVALDCSLFMKGLLLQSANELRNIVYDSDDRTLINQYEQMLRRQESEQLSEFLNGHSDDLELLHHPVIMAGLIEMKKSLLFNCTQLKQTLKKCEVAVEMVETNIEYNNRSIKTIDQQYGAIIVKKDKDAYYVPLTRGKELIQIARQNIQQLNAKVWQPMEQEIKGCHTIYFSATGLLYNLPVENLTSTDGQSINLKVYRMSSLRNLIDKERKGREKAAIFGGLTYYLGATSFKKQMTNTHSSVFRDLPNVAALRFAEREISELPGTAKEAAFLNQLLRQHNIPTSLNEKEYGTERTFKLLSGQRVTLLHIGTHGYVDTEGESTTDENLLLSRCGLLLAGASNTIYSEDTPKIYEDDGILTAREICSMDLRGLDIAVLSACKTGTGKIGSDGVFGLQRGFKKAGANSILMSLWDVDDEATCLLMTEFYRNRIAEKMTKHDALEAAKQTVRSHKEKGWDDPKYWAAFILLDGLD